MKKLTLMAMLAGAIVFVSCGGDDEFSNEINLGEFSTNDFGAYYDDYGQYCLTGSVVREAGCSATHDGTGFIFADGTYGANAYWPSNYTFTVYGTFLSPIDQGLAGTYDLKKNWNDINSVNQTGNRIATFYIEWPEEVAGCCITNVEGTITLKGTLPNLTATFEAEVSYYPGSNGARQEGVPPTTVLVKGKYNGEFLERMID